DLPVVELDRADRLVGGVASEPGGSEAAVATVLLVLLEPSGDGRRRDAAIGFLFETRGSLLERVAEIVVGECGKDHAQGVGLVAQRGGAGRERAFARGAAPQLDDPKLLFSRATASDIAAAAVRTRFRLFVGEWNASNAWNRWRHTDWG